MSVFFPQVELRPFLSDPELMGAGDGSSHISVALPRHDGGYQTLPSRGRTIERQANILIVFVINYEYCTNGRIVKSRV